MTDIIAIIGMALAALVIALIPTLFATVFVWWTMATFFPSLGLTYWSLILPVYTIKLLTQPINVNN